MSEYVNIIWFFAALSSFFIIYFMENSFFYRQEINACKKFNGNCDLCSCWSCHRKDYLNKKENLK